MTTLMLYRRLVRSRLGVPVTDDFFADNIIDDNVNMALAAVTTEHRWPWNERVDQFTLPAGDKSFPLPDGWAATRSLFNGDREVGLVSPTDLARWVDDLSGPPRVWTPQYDRIEVRPIGGGSLTHSYYIDETWLLQDDDAPNLPDRYAAAVVAKAAELLAQREDDRQMATVHLGEYATWIARMRKDVRSSTGPITPRVRPGYQGSSI